MSCHTESSIVFALHLGNWQSTTQNGVVRHQVPVNQPKGGDARCSSPPAQIDLYGTASYCTDISRMALPDGDKA